MGGRLIHRRRSDEVLAVRERLYPRGYEPNRAPEHHHHGAFGEDAFGSYAESAARFFGTPQYIAGQTFVVIVWVILNAVGLSLRWDLYPTEQVAALTREIHAKLSG